MKKMFFAGLCFWAAFLVMLLSCHASPAPFDPGMSSPMVVRLTSYGHGTAALAAITNAYGTTKVTVLIPMGPTVLSNSFTLPSNYAVQFEQGALLSGNTGMRDLVIQGPLVCNDTQIINPTHLRVSLPNSTANIMWFGAANDGSNDAKASITNALYASDTVDIPEGTFTVSSWDQVSNSDGDLRNVSVLISKSNKKIVGRGKDRTRIHFDGSSNPYVLINLFSLECVDNVISNVYIGGFTVTGSGSNPAIPPSYPYRDVIGIEVEGPNYYNVTIEDVHVKSTKYTGLRVWRGDQGPIDNGPLWFTRCSTEFCGENGFNTIGRNMFFTDCFSRQNAFHGWEAQAYQSRFVNCDATDNQQWGYSIQGDARAEAVTNQYSGTGLTMVGCTAHRNGASGTGGGCLLGGLLKGSTIIGCDFSQNYQFGLFFYPVFSSGAFYPPDNNTIIGCTIADNMWSGVGAYGGTNTITACKIGNIATTNQIYCLDVSTFYGDSPKLNDNNCEYVGLVNAAYSFNDGMELGNMRSFNPWAWRGTASGTNLDYGKSSLTALGPDYSFPFVAVGSGHPAYNQHINTSANLPAQGSLYVRIDGSTDSGLYQLLGTTTNDWFAFGTGGGGSGGMVDPGGNGIVYRDSLNHTVPLTAGSGITFDLTGNTISSVGASLFDFINGTNIFVDSYSGKIRFNWAPDDPIVFSNATIGHLNVLNPTWQPTNSTLSDLSTNTTVGTGRVVLESAVGASGQLYGAGTNVVFSGTTNINVPIVAGTNVVLDSYGGALRINATGNGSNTNTTWDTIYANSLVLTNALSPANGGMGLTNTPTIGQIPIGDGTNYAPGTINVYGGLTKTNTGGNISIGYSGTSGTMYGAGTNVVFSGTGPTNINVQVWTVLPDGTTTTASTNGSAITFSAVAGAGSTNGANWVASGTTNAALPGNAYVNGIFATNAFSCPTNTYANVPSAYRDGAIRYASDVLTPWGMGSTIFWDGSNWRLPNGVLAATDVNTYLINCMKLGLTGLSGKYDLIIDGKWPGYFQATGSSYPFPWGYASVGNSATITYGDQNTNHLAGVLLKCNTTSATGYTYLQMGNMPFTEQFYQPTLLSFKIHCSEANTNFCQQCGLDSHLSDAFGNDVITFLYDGTNSFGFGASPYYQCIVKTNSGTSGTFVSTVSPSTSAFTDDVLTMIINWQTVTFYINSNPVYTNSYAGNPATLLYPKFGVRGVSTTAVRSMNVDNARIHVRRNWTAY